MTLSEEDDYLPISALQHWVFCDRQAALIHVLGRWRENAHTTLGRIVHERVDDGASTVRPGLQVLRSVPLRSDRLRIRGIADVVEVETTPAGLRVTPVEYKKTGARRGTADDVQVGAQAIALEEMMDIVIAEGAVFMAKSRRRRVVPIDAALRARVTSAAAQMHELIASRRVPPARLDRRCVDCSLRDECGPDVDLPVGSLAFQLRAALR